MRAGDTIDDEELLHVRDYTVRAYRHSPTVMRIHGELQDVKPDGLMFLPEDTEPLTIHHMTVDLFVEVPSLEIVDVVAEMHTRPNLECADVLPDYRKLVGLSVVRGFSHQVKALFGGPRACTHITILLQAMAPAAIQSLWAMNRPAPGETPVALTPEDQRRLHFERNRNTCHVWAEDGLMFERLEQGEAIPPPIWGEERLARHGIPIEEWHNRAHGA